MFELPSYLIRVADQTDQSELRQRTRGPACLAPSPEPMMSGLVVFVGRPQQGGEDVQVQQGRLHGRSSRNLSTSAVVTLGERRLRFTTRRPFRTSVTSGRSAP